MMANRDIRKAASAALRGPWFWRLLSVGMVLYFFYVAANYGVNHFFATYGVMTIPTFLEAKLKAMQSGLGYQLPSLVVAAYMVGATAFQIFAVYLFAAIAAIGISAAALKTVRNETKGWFSGSFLGFKQPLGNCWLLVLMNFKIFLWCLLLIFPGLIAMYRYRQAWYLKCEQPEVSAGRCLKESGRLMKGHKWQAFMLDLSYLFKAILAMLLMICAGIGAAAVGDAIGEAGSGVIGAVVGFVGFYYLLWVIICALTARTIFYEEVKACASKSSESSPS